MIVIIIEFSTANVIVSFSKSENCETSVLLLQFSCSFECSCNECFEIHSKEKWLHYFHACDLLNSCWLQFSIVILYSMEIIVIRLYFNENCTKLTCFNIWRILFMCINILDFTKVHTNRWWHCGKNTLRHFFFEICVSVCVWVWSFKTIPLHWNNGV